MNEPIDNQHLPDGTAPERQVEIAALAPGDAGAVRALYETVLALTPHGHLAEREADEFDAILGDPEKSASVGAWRDGELVAYSLCSVGREPVYEASPLIALLHERGEDLWTGKGTVIDPRLRGRLLMSRMLARRAELISRHGGQHDAGLIATENLPSLGASLRAGAWVVGLERDAYCENFVCYGGPLQEEFSGAATDSEQVDDLPAISARLAAGWVGVRMERSAAGGTRRLTMAQLSPQVPTADRGGQA